jgi:hypothetical protein
MLTLVAGWNIMEARPMNSPDSTEIANPFEPGSRVPPKPRTPATGQARPAALPAAVAGGELCPAEPADPYHRFLTALLRGLSVWGV